MLFEPDLPGAPHAKVRVWVRTWGEIIDDAKRRLSYFQDQLQHDPSFDEARDYLRRNHGNVIPEGLLADHTNENRGNGVDTATAVELRRIRRAAIRAGNRRRSAVRIS